MFAHIEKSLSEMIRIPTVSGKGHEKDYRIREYRELLEKLFPHLFGAARKIPVGEAMLLYLKGAGREKRPVLFTGHMDVVPASETPAWEYPPFSGQIKDGSIWGRGSQDMKGPHCALLSAFDACLEEGWIPPRDIWLYFSCDEEVGGRTTEEAADYLRREGVHLEAVFDEGGTISEDFMGLVPGKAAMFGIAEKGSLEYHFTARSGGGHAMNPPADSGIVQIARFVQEAESAFRSGTLFHRQLSDGSRRMLEEIAALRDGQTARKLLLAARETDPAYPILHEVCKEADTMLGATIAFTMIQGGTVMNAMPQEVVLTANVRVSAVEPEQAVTAKLTALAGKYGLHCALVSGSDASPESPVDGSAYQAMRRAVQEYYPGLPVLPFILGGGTDSKHFLGLTDQVLRFSPMYAAPFQGRGVHGENESAYVSAVRDAAGCYYTLLKKHL